jgi:exopolysaccharide biosynthesis polyprenyl glycosylphosphotransferase
VRSAAARRVLDVRRWRTAMVATDLLVAAIAGLVSVNVRFGETQASVQGLSYVMLAASLPLIWVCSVWLAGAYDTRFLTSGAEMFKRVFNAGVGLLAAAAIVSYLLHADLSRIFVALAVPAMTFGTLGTRYTLRQLLHRRVNAGESVHRVLVIGARHEVLHLRRHIERSPRAGFAVVGTLYLEGSPDEIGGEDELAAVPGLIRDLDADAIAVAGTSALAPGELRKLAWSLEGENVTLIVAPAVTDFAGPRILVRPVDGLPLLYIDEPEFSGARLWAKHVIDRIAAGFGMLLISPFLAAIAIAIWLDDRGPILFRQVRVGRHGEEFEMLKFRTMEVDAEKRLHDLHQLNEHDGVLFKIRHDPRVTRVGRFLRRHSLDELPQLLNVIRGDMSLVGPRPPLPSEVARYGDGWCGPG